MKLTKVFFKITEKTEASFITIEEDGVFNNTVETCIEQSYFDNKEAEKKFEER